MEAKQRLSKLQKWVLLTTLQKTVAQDNTGLIVPRGLADRYKKGTTDFYFEYLFRAEILLNYFRLPVCLDKRCNWDIERFKGNNNKAHATLTRSLEKLEETKLIKIFEGKYSRWTGIQLTDKGKEIALKLTNGN